MLYFFEFDYPNCLRLSLRAAKRSPLHPFEQVEDCCALLPLQADSIVIVGVADGSPAVGQVYLTYSFIFWYFDGTLTLIGARSKLLFIPL